MQINPPDLMEQSDYILVEDFDP
jgi:Ca2+-binding EF-hand superfamily protein